MQLPGRILGAVLRAGSALAGPAGPQGQQAASRSLIDEEVPTGLRAVHRLYTEAFHASPRDEELRDGASEAVDDAVTNDIAAVERYLKGVREDTHANEHVHETEHLTEPLVRRLVLRADHLEAAGRLERAAYERERALAFALRHLGPVDHARLQRQFGLALGASADFADALVTLDTASGTFRDHGMPLQAALTTLTKANILLWLGDTRRVLELVDDVRADLAGRPGVGASRLGQLASAVRLAWRAPNEAADFVAGQDVDMRLAQLTAQACLAEGRLDEAGAHFAQAQARAGITGLEDVYHFHHARVALARGDLAAAQSSLDLAERALQEAGAWAQNLLRSVSRDIEVLRARLDLAHGRPGEALDRLELVAGELAAHPDRSLAWKVHDLRAQCLQMAGSPALALQAWLDCADALDEVRKSPLGYRLDSTFLSDKSAVLERAIDAAVEQGDGAAAARLIELVKARALSAVLSVPPHLRGGRSAAELQFDRLSAQIDVLDYLDSKDEGSSAARERRTDLARERDRLLEQIRLADPRWRALSEPRRFDLTAVHDALGPGRAALTLHHRPGRIVAVLLRDGKATVAARALTDQTEASLRSYAENLRRATPRRFDADPAEHDGLALHDLLPAATAAQILDGVETLLVVPHRTLHLLPWHGLTVESERLCRTVAVGTLPSLTALAVLDSGEPEPPSAVAAVGDPDYTGRKQYRPIGAGAELLRAAADPWQARLAGPPVTGAAADATAVLGLLSDTRLDGGLLHVVCHGRLDAADPLSSALVLTASHLEAATLALARAQAREVVLAVCSAGWRPERVGPLDLAGDDALGLTASLLEAGARTVVVSVPPAHAGATQSFLSHWHKARSGGAPPLQASRAAQNALLADGALPPALWIGMTTYSTR